MKDIIDARNRYRIAYKNYINVMWNMLRRRSKIKVIFHNGDSSYIRNDLVLAYSKFSINNNIHIKDLHLDMDNIKFTYNNKNITLEAEGLSPDIWSVFGLDEYSFLKVENQIVIDIGANMGDSPIYFALNNAKKVIALEPYPYLYNIALKNIKKNNIDDKITLLNAGYGQDSNIKLDPDFENERGGSALKAFDNGIDIKTLSLNTILNDYNIDNAVLKMDCEGCEYNLIKEDNNTLKKFKRIQVEYHYGYEKLKEKLEDAGFNVTYSEPKKIFNKFAIEHNMLIGNIYAKLDV